MELNYTFWVHIFLVALPFLATVQANREKRETADELDKIVNNVNHLNTSWTAAKDEKFLHYLNKYRSLPVVPRERTKTVAHRAMNFENLPRTFDSRTMWPHCRRIISRIRDQGECGSCWAVNSASVISDRVCIGTKGRLRFHASAEDILSCCYDCTPFKDNICGGGFGAKAFHFWKNWGVVSGGEKNSMEGCKPYSEETYNSRTTFSCARQCSNRNYGTAYDNDKVYGKVAYRLPAGDEEKIMDDIFKYGPVLALVVVYDDLFTYKKGIYVATSRKNVTNHFVRLIGWGEQRRVKYWLGANSWSTRWGSAGFFKILRGNNHCEIEAEISAGRLTGSTRRSDNVSMGRVYQPSLIKCLFLLLLVYVLI